MTQISGIIPKTLQQIKQTALERPSSNLQPTTATLPLKDDPEGKQAVSVLLFECYQTMNLYGREPEQLQQINDRFMIGLADKPAVQCITALNYHLNHGTEFPTVGMIREIMYRGGNKPPFRKEIYLGYQRIHAEYRTADQHRYIREYEDYFRDGRE